MLHLTDKEGATEPESGDKLNHDQKPTLQLGGNSESIQTPIPKPSPRIAANIFGNIKTYSKSQDMTPEWINVAIQSNEFRFMNL